MRQAFTMVQMGRQGVAMGMLLPRKRESRVFAGLIPGRALKGRRCFLLGTVILFLCLVSPVFAGPADRVSESVLPNGLKVILLENHKVPLVTFQVWYRVGSRNENWGKTGLSHLLEHMMFKGTKKVSGERFVRIIEENGGNNNAFTSHDFTAYYENLSADRVGVAIDLEADRMRHLVLREKDFRTERMVVMEERRLRTEDNPQAYLFEQVYAVAFAVSPYHWPVIGWMEDLQRLTLDDLKAHYRTYYSPANAFLVVVGDFKKEEVLRMIRKAFGSYPKGARPPQERNAEPPQSGERRVCVEKEAKLPFVVKGYHVPNLSDPDSYVLEVIEALLSRGKSSRLYQNLVRERRLVLEVDADHPLLSHDPGLFYLSAVPMPGKDVAEVEKALDGELQRLQREQVGDDELEKAKNQLEAAFVYGQDSLFSQAMMLARFEMAGGWRRLDDYLPAIRKVTAADVRRVAGKYFTRQNSTVGILIPLPPTEGRPAPQGAPGPDQMIR